MYCQLHNTLFIATDFGKDVAPKLRSTVTIQIEKQPPDAFEFSAVGSAGSILHSEHLSMSDGRFDCTEEGVEFRSGWKGYGSDTMGAAGGGTRTIVLNKGTGDSLIAHKYEFEAGAIVVVPYAGSTNRWFLWSPASRVTTEGE